MQLKPTRITSGLLAAGLVAFVSPGASAQHIDLVNPGFESNDFADPGTSLFLLDTFDATFEVPGWMQFGPPPDFNAQISYTGIFNNVPTSVGSTPFPAIDNSGDNPPGVLTDRLALIGVDDSNIVDRTPLDSGIYQETGEQFASGQTYTLSLLAGGSVTSQPSSDNPSTDPAKLIISIGYLDINDAFVAVQSQDITQFINDSSDDPNEINDRFETLDEFEITGEFNLLKPFSVTTIDPVAGDPSLLGKEIAVQILSPHVAGGAGFFSVDSVQLTQVPEPGSLGLLAVAGMLAFRRRR